jgi:DNA polymerase V
LDNPLLDMLSCDISNRRVAQGRNDMSERSLDSLPLWPEPAYAGFGNPAEDYAEPALNLHDLVAPHPNSTYFIRIKGSSMWGACIAAGAIVVVDRSLTASHGKIVVARVGEHLLLKRLQLRERKIFLLSDPPEQPAIELDQRRGDEIWGVVTYCVSPILPR